MTSLDGTSHNTDNDLVHLTRGTDIRRGCSHDTDCRKGATSLGWRCAWTATITGLGNMNCTQIFPEIYTSRQAEECG